MTTLIAQDLSLAFGGLHAVVHFNLELTSGETVAIIGPNGAGKTTIFNLLCGIYQPNHGTIHLDQHLLNGLDVYEINRLGIARTFQNIRLFKSLSVLMNVKIAIYRHYGLATTILRHPSFLRQEQQVDDEARQLLDRFGLTAYLHHKASDLPYGLQRRLEIARAMATQPKVLLLDEPACGMNPREAQMMAELIREIQAERNLAVLLIDHQMAFVMSLCQRIIVLDFGEVIAMGDPTSIRKNAAVIESYLGESC